MSEAGIYGGEVMKLSSQPTDMPVPIPPEGWPLLVTLDDITKPETVRRVNPEDLAAVFAEGVRLKAVTLEITGEAVTEERVEAVLTWLGAYPEPSLCPATGGPLAQAPFCRLAKMATSFEGPIMRR